MRHVAFHDSARKHGYSDEEIFTMWESWAEEVYLDEDIPGRVLHISFDSTGRSTEVIGIVFDRGERVLFIHAMPMTKSTVKLMRRLRRQ